MNTITRSITLDLSTARHLREEADRFKQAAEAEWRPDVANRFSKQAVFLLNEADFYEARANRLLNECISLANAGHGEYLIAVQENSNEH
jgi:hypothetical protein